MKKLQLKYIEDFEKLVRDWDRLKLSPNSHNLSLVMQDLQEMQYDLRHLEL